MSWDKAYDMACEMDQLREKIGRLEEELVDLMCKNESLKTENEMLRRSIDFNAGQRQKYATSTFCGTEEEFRAWRKQYDTDMRDRC